MAPLEPSFTGAPYPGVSHDRVLLRTLPTSEDLSADVRTHLSKRPLFPPLRIESQYNERESRKDQSPEADGPLASPPIGKSGVKRPKSGWQLHHVLAAIDKCDIARLADIRASNFSLLLQAQSGAGMTPLQYAMNLRTPEAKSITLTLVGFLSRWVNHLDESVILPMPGTDGKKPDQNQVARTRALQRALRTNLRMAMAFGLQHGHLEPLASYVQILVMSEHAAWLNDHVGCIAGIISAPPGISSTSGDTTSGGTTLSPIAEATALATKAIDHFIAAEIVRRVAEVQDYRNNAVTDMVMMGCAKVLGRPISASSFGRDERVLDGFGRRLREALAVEKDWTTANETEKKKMPSPRPRRAVLRHCEQVYEVMSQRSLGLADKVKRLEAMKTRPRQTTSSES